AMGAVARLRAGGGPEFIECRTYRWREHVGPNEDFDQGYRARDDLQPWLKDDPVETVGAALAATQRACIDSEIEAEVAAAIAFAEASAFPPLERLATNVFAGE